MGISKVVVGMAHSSPSPYKCHSVHSRRCTAPRLGLCRVVELQILAALAAACETIRYWILPWTIGDH